MRRRWLVLEMVWGNGPTLHLGFLSWLLQVSQAGSLIPGFQHLFASDQQGVWGQILPPL